MSKEKHLEEINQAIFKIEEYPIDTVFVIISVRFDGINKQIYPNISTRAAAITELDNLQQIVGDWEEYDDDYSVAIIKDNEIICTFDTDNMNLEEI